MFGKNPQRKPIINDTGFLQIKEIIPTFQGEGPYVGQPAIFVRLGGCNLACKFCDTLFEDFQLKPTTKIIQEIVDISIENDARIKLIVITGGEPLRQPIESLCKQLIDKGYIVQIETNGSLYRKLDDRVKIICSPKVINNKYLSIDPRVLEKVTALKFLISSSHKGYDDLPPDFQKYYKKPIYLQPMDEYDKEKNRQNRMLTLKLASKYSYNISLQTHKIWEIY